VQGLAGKTATLTAKDLADLPAPRSKPAPRQGLRGTDPDLVLRLVGAPAGPMLHGAPVKDFVVVTGADALPPSSPWPRPTPIPQGIGDPRRHRRRRAARPARGPVALVIDGDLKPSRSVRNVVKIQLEAAP